ncbi:MAG: class I SAM-dependent methyltransferase [Lachnospiraceae bacterium]|nr:class I SAM-dependent methyltransferase [Lachnospiraceae bacterium]
MTKQQWDKKLNIDTVGRDASNADEIHYPYEPTPYSVLERLAETNYINSNNRIVDYGCGKGRVGFFLNYKLGCQVTGIEYDSRICGQALQNLDRYGTKQNIEFVCMDAGEYQVKHSDCFYFFNPFSVKVLQTVIGQIIQSYYENPRTMRFFFYYPSDEYVAYLMTAAELDFVDEIDCRDLFDGTDERERILIFEIADFGFDVK